MNLRRSYFVRGESYSWSWTYEERIPYMKVLRSTKPSTPSLLVQLSALVLFLPFAAHAQIDLTADTQHPALFLVGDSIMHTGVAPGDVGPWGWGAEIIP